MTEQKWLITCIVVFIIGLFLGANVAITMHTVFDKGESQIAKFDFRNDLRDLYQHQLDHIRLYHQPARPPRPARPETETETQELEDKPLDKQATRDEIDNVKRRLRRKELQPHGG